ncbi:NACHT domain- and WD repeat-containing protein 1 [Dasypus novemcinctus]|uniref:NACHT domain- and WD repeat-containing protein 1 n=1 Tax=Dasypus novemcinctus TaxID=9361 RepID=UPI00265F0ECD|nr:NACHT domain- and WD repeat-containing protein 1 [Dasypus novemcinctus]
MSSRGGARWLNGDIRDVGLATGEHGPLRSWNTRAHEEDGRGRDPLAGDMDAEREALESRAYPEVRDFCQKHGLAFEVVDLRWGLRSAEATEHLTADICLEEIDRCQKTSIGPSFVALLGDQYGPCPVPPLIEETEWEALRAQLTARPRDLELVTRHFRKDENAVPPAYVLQGPGPGESPGPEEASLASVLRSGAQEAWRLGLISQEQWNRYHRSVFAWELERGLLSAPDAAGGATVFLREIPDLEKHVLEDCALPLVDRLPDGCLDTDARQLLAGLKARLAQAHPGLLHAHRLPWSRDLVNPKNKAHARYLRELGEQLVARANRQVLASLRESPPGGDVPAWLLQDVGHHLAQGAEAARGFCGRGELLARLGQRLRRDEGAPHAPLVLFGPPGIGKTALMAALAERAAGLLGRKTVTVLRLLGTSRASRDARGLVRGLCLQLSLALGLPPPPAQALAAHHRATQLFHALLHAVPRRDFESLVILLDALDELEPRGLAWLPARCPSRVHLVLSARPGPRGALDTLRRTLGDPDAGWEVTPLAGDEGQEMVRRLLDGAGRTLSPGQRDLLWASLPDDGHPGRLRLAFEEARRWASFAAPAPLASTAQEATRQLCARLEQTHGRLLVSHALGYIVSSRHGLSEAELKDVLSLDDEVLEEVYREWTPPSRELLRFPPLSWVRLRRDLGDCLARRPADGTTLLALAHRQLAEAVHERYLRGPEGTRRHGLLADFFLGTWSEGARKLSTLPCLGTPLSLDRKVAPQPLWFSESVANLRKLEEMPFHLLRAGRLEELKQEVLGNVAWISCRAISGGLESVLDDFELCAPHVDAPELGLLREAVELCRPAVELRGPEKSTLYAELLARLLALAAPLPPLVAQLCQQAQGWFRTCPHPVLVPLAGFLPPPGGPLRATLTGCHKGITAMAWSLEEELLVIGSHDGIIVVWDMKEHQAIHFLSGHTGEVRCVKVFAEGTLAVSSSRDRTLRLWSLRTGQEKFTIWDGGSRDPPEPRFCSLHVDETSKVVYSASDSKVNAWSLETAEPVFRILADASHTWMGMAVLAPQASLLLLSTPGAVSLWSAATGTLQGKRPLSSVKEATPTCGAPAQKQGKLVTGFSNGAISLVSSEGDALLEKLPEAVRFLVVSEDESLLAAGFGRSVRIYLADTQGFHRFMATDLAHEDAVETAVFGPDNNLIVTGSRDALIQVWSLSEQGALLDVLEGVGAPVSLLARGGALVASASRLSSSFKVWDLRRVQKPQACVPFPDRSGLAAVSHGGSYVYFPKTGDKSKVAVWDVAEGEEQDVLDVSNEVRCLEVAEQARLLFTGLVSGTVLVIPLDSRQDVLCIPPPEARQAVACLALSKDEACLAVAYDCVVLVLDISPGDPCPVIDGPTYTFYTQLPEAIASVAVLGGHRVVYGMTDGGLFLYECARSQVFPLEAHGCHITCVAVSHGEQLAVSGSDDALLCLWDLQACKCKFEMSYTSSYCRGVQCTCFSKDDKYVYAGLKDRSIIVWSVTDGTLLAIQVVHAMVNRIIPTSNGFIAPTSHGYLIRERFHCPSSRTSQQDPLKTFKKAVWMVKSRQREELAAAAPQDSGSESPHGNESKSIKRSQVCLIV